MSTIYLTTLFALILNGLQLTNGRNCTIRQEELTTFESGIISLHNIIRSRHEDTDNLCWSRKLAEDAQSWADKLTENPDGIIKSSNYFIMDESNVSDDFPAVILRYGENIYRGNIIMSVSADTAAQNSITDWYSQEHDYNYNFDSAVFSDKTKEFTQLVWKETDRVGCGYSKREPLFYIVVCEYTPTGNEGSRSVYHDNVNKKMTCDAPVIPHGKTVEMGPFYLDQKIRVSCDTGFQLQGSFRGTCGRQEQFEFDDYPRCTGCEVPTLQDGFPNRDVGSIVPETEWVKFSCNTGYTLDSAIRVLECSGNELMGNVPRCRKEQHCLRPIIEDGFASTPKDDTYDLYEVWDNNIADGENITIHCKEGYEMIGNRSGVCRDEKFGPVATCNISDASAVSGSSTTPSLTTFLLILSLLTVHLLALVT